MPTRRESLKLLAKGLSSTAFGATLAPHLAFGAGHTTSGPKRVVFFMQNHGMEPETCIPTNMTKSGSLEKAVLPEPIKALQPFRDKIHIINGLHGKHTSPSHSAFFGALGGYRGGDGVPPSASTIDHDLSQALPPTLLPHLCIGMDSLDNMRAKPTVSGLSASGAGQPIFMYSNPSQLYELIYGGISQGEIRKQYEASSGMLKKLQRISNNKANSLPASEKRRYQTLTSGITEMNALRDFLLERSDHLAKFAPKVTSSYTNPEFETDWHDSLLDLGISALKSGITNVLTVGSGRGEIFGSWYGLGVQKQGHNLGHMKQLGNPIWDKIRSYNTRMLIKIMEELESVPEGSGTMMDNTLIVYTSNNADKQHTKGTTWPVVLIGNGGGAIKTGQFTQYNGKRPINALYSTLLKTVGVNVDRYNLSQAMANRFDSGSGVLSEILS